MTKFDNYNQDAKKQKKILPSLEYRMNNFSWKIKQAMKTSEKIFKRLLKDNYKT